MFFRHPHSDTEAAEAPPESPELLGFVPAHAARVGQSLGRICPVSIYSKGQQLQLGSASVLALQALAFARLFGSARMGGSFDTNYSCSTKVALRALSAGHTFCAVASTINIITKTIPEAPKSQRLQLLESHQAKTTNSGMPANLVDYIAREVAKMKSSAQAGR